MNPGNDDFLEKNTLNELFSVACSIGFHVFSTIFRSLKAIITPRYSTSITSPDYNNYHL